MAPIVIFEGCDLAGKSTLIKRVIERLVDRRQTFTYRHFGVLPENWNYDTDYIRSLGPATMYDLPLILDRFIDSELVYGKVFRGGPNRLFGNDQRDSVTRMLELCKATVVYCDCSLATISSRYDEKPDAMGDKEKIFQVWEEYKRLYAADIHWSMRVKMYRVDTDAPVAIDKIEAICDMFGSPMDIKHEIK